MNAGIKGATLIKADRIVDRVQDFGNVFLNMQKEKKQKINEKDFKDFVKSICIIVTTELNDKGIDRYKKN
jgi:hypothetical protein